MPNQRSISKEYRIALKEVLKYLHSFDSFSQIIENNSVLSKDKKLIYKVVNNDSEQVDLKSLKRIFKNIQTIVLPIHLMDGSTSSEKITTDMFSLNIRLLSKYISQNSLGLLYHHIFSDVNLRGNSHSSIYQSYHSVQAVFNYLTEEEVVRTEKNIVGLSGVMTLETELIFFYRNFFKATRKKASIPDELIKELHFKYLRFATFLYKYDNVNVNYLIFQIGVLDAIVKNNIYLAYQRLLEEYKYLSITDSNTHETKVRNVIYRLAECLIRLDRGSEAINYMNLVSVSRATFGWFRHKFIYSLAHIQNKDYTKAFKIYNDTVSKRSFTRIVNGSLLFNYEMLRPYIYICVFLNGDEVSSLISTRSVNKLINVNPDHYKDKAGLNVAQIIAHLILYIMLRDDTAIEIRESAVNRYISRYLTKGNNYRANCFLKMLFIVPQCNYNVDVIKLKTKKLYKKLVKVPRIEDRQPMELEPVEYERLWEMLMHYLRQRKILFA